MTNPLDNWLGDLIQKKQSARVDVLDVGCGSGTYLTAQATHFNAENITWTGIDPCPPADNDIKRIRYLKAKAEDLGIPNESIDYLICTYSLHFFDDLDQAINEFWRVLKKGGRIMIVNIDPADMEKSWLYEYFPDSRVLDLKRFPSLKTVVELLESVGLQVSFDYQRRRFFMPAQNVIAEVLKKKASQLQMISEQGYNDGFHRLSLEALDPEKVILEEVASFAVRAIKI
jgi:ubiquinone/menaquinone biosynthesis C-methylase UbiE